MILSFETTVAVISEALQYIPDFNPVSTFLTLISHLNSSFALRLLLIFSSEALYYTPGFGLTPKPIKLFSEVAELASIR